MKKSTALHNAIIISQIALALHEQGKLHNPKDFLGLVLGTLLEEERQKMLDDDDYKPEVFCSEEEALAKLKAIASAQNLDEIYEILGLERKKEPRKTVYAYVPYSLYERVSELAKERGMSISALVNYALLRVLEEEEFHESE